MNSSKTFNRYVNRINQGFKWVEMILVSGSIIIMALVLIGNFMSRYIFNFSWTFSEEIGSFALIFVTFAGTAYCVRNGRHIRMSAFFDLMSFKAKKVLMCIICSVMVLLMFYLGYLGLQWAMQTYSLGKVSSVLRVPMYLIYMVVPISFFLSGIQYIITFLYNILDKGQIWVGTEARDFEVES